MRNVIARSRKATWQSLVVFFVALDTSVFGMWRRQ